MQIEHVHFYVEDAKVWRDWFVSHLGFQVVANYAMPREKSFHTCTEVVKSGSVYFLLSSPLLSTSPVAEFLRQHPPGVADLAFRVEDVETAIAFASAHGAEIIQPVQQYQQGEVDIKWGKIAAWGSLIHTLIERRENSFPLASSSPSFVTAIDHIVLNVAAGDLEPAVALYENILGFQRQQRFKVQTDRSALHSQVMGSRNGSIQLPINEPASANSQIQEFLDVNKGAGIQHIALRTDNIINAVARFRICGLSLLPIPNSYYSQVVQRQELPLSDDEFQAIAQQGILVDWSQQTPQALLLQIFTQPIFRQPTFFFEFIERRFQAQGFGERNFRALFEAIEREQIKRGHLVDSGS